MEKEYYYLDGKTQKGPFSFSQLKNENISQETLFWEESLDKWGKAKDIKELSELFSKKSPPPIPEYVSDNNTTPSSEEINETPNKKNLNRSRTIFFIFFIFILFGGLCFFSLRMYKHNQKKEIDLRIDSIFNDKSKVLDCETYKLSGEFVQTGYPENQKNVTTYTLPGSSVTLRSDDFDDKIWYECTDLYSVYLCSSCPFRIYKLAKIDRGYEYEEINGGDIGFKYKENKDYFYSAIAAIMIAQEYLKAHNGDDAYVSGKLNFIKRFPTIENRYYSIKNVSPDIKSSSEHKDATWETPKHDKGVQTEKYCAYYDISGKYYEIVENENIFLKDFLIALSLCLFIVLIFTLIILKTKPKFLLSIQS